jgi:hypothetical protein
MTEEIIVQNLAAILAAITGICGAIISIVAFGLSLKSQKKTRGDVAITRQGIVEGFKNAVVPTNVQVSLNRQVEKMLSEFRTEMIGAIKIEQDTRTKMTYWLLHILAETVSYNKLSKAQKGEIAQLLALVTDDERQLDTGTN